MYHTHNVLHLKLKRVDLHLLLLPPMVKLPHTWDSMVCLVLTCQNGVIAVLPWPTCISLVVDVHW